MTLDSLPDLDTSGLCLVKTLSTALTCWPYRNMALRDGARTSTWWWACESRRGRSGRGSGRCSGLSVVRGRLRGLSWGNRPHFGADQPRRPQPRRSMRWADVYVPHVSPASMSPEAQITALNAELAALAASAAQPRWTGPRRRARLSEARAECDRCRHRLERCGIRRVLLQHQGR